MNTLHQLLIAENEAEITELKSNITGLEIQIENNAKTLIQERGKFEMQLNREREQSAIHLAKEKEQHEIQLARKVLQSKETTLS